MEKLFQNPIVEAASLKSRNIRDTITERYGVGVDSHGSIHFTYFDLHTARPVATKSRSSLKEKDFRWRGEASKALLFGSHLYEKKHNAVILCEGETDTLAAAEMLEGSSIGGNRILSLGIAKGAASAEGIIKESLEWLLERFDRFYIAFDNDTPGQEATESVINRLPMGKAYRVVLPKSIKDIGEFLCKHDHPIREFAEIVKSAQRVIPSVFATEAEMVDGTLDWYYNRELRKGSTTGYKSLDKLIGGFTPGSVNVVMGGTGTGKSLFALQLAYNAASPQHPPLIISLEMPSHEVLLRMASFELHDYSIHYPDGALRDRDEMKEVMDAVSKNFKMFKAFGSLALDDLIRSIEVAVEAYDTKLVVFDHIGFAVPSGEWALFGQYMKALKSIAVQKGIAIVVVSHVSTKENAKDGGATELSLTDIRASKDVIQDADCVLGIERNRQETTMRLRTLKVHRSSGGRYGEIEFDFVNGRYVELDETDKGGDAYEKQLRETVLETVPEAGVRTSEIGVQEGVHSGLHIPTKPGKVQGRKAILGDRSEGQVLERRRSKVVSSEAIKPTDENGASVPKTRRQSEQPKIPDVSRMGKEARHTSRGNQRTKQDTARSSSVRRPMFGQRRQKQKDNEKNFDAATLALIEKGKERAKKVLY